MNNKATIVPSKLKLCDRQVSKKEIRLEYEDSQENVLPCFRYPLDQFGGTSEEVPKENQVGESRIFHTK